ncbi:eukaryotic translation initiation factor 4 gamma 3-like isoform X8 [Leptotrombidium deliense]|uniref:Eukaryotic translation initiation factor 4 gamma 3-like isoform X8 n=1 Tax=Leptotrombidium deliense TaxID=299467 RepID=A0A443RS37_9ACAR|nr:eukaryotic translation initiation factor 4 gamma 3-like isoform X8 [Leptotrombidium deliense]
MLKANIMMSCVERLLRENEEESLECLCTLLMTIGSKLECEVNEFEIKKGLKKDSVFSSYINALFEFISENRISERVRFMIQDVLDIRINNWKARKIQDENKPKTIDEIQHSGRQPRPLPTFLCDGDAFC